MKKLITIALLLISFGVMAQNRVFRFEYKGTTTDGCEFYRFSESNWNMGKSPNYNWMVKIIKSDIKKVKTFEIVSVKVVKHFSMKKTIPFSYCPKSVKGNLMNVDTVYNVDPSLKGGSYFSLLPTELILYINSYWEHQIFNHLKTR